MPRGVYERKTKPKLTVVKASKPEKVTVRKHKRRLSNKRRKPTETKPIVRGIQTIEIPLIITLTVERTS